MRDIYVEKLTLNVGCGTELPIPKAKTVLERLTKRKIVITKTRKRSTFGVAKNKEIGCKVTIREGAQEMLMRLLEAKEKKLHEHNFDATGNFAFGIQEYIDISGMEYDPTIGIVGMDVCVTLARPGYRVKKRKCPAKIGKRHVITKEEAMQFVTKAFGVVIE